MRKQLRFITMVCLAMMTTVVVAQNRQAIPGHAGQFTPTGTAEQVLPQEEDIFVAQQRTCATVDEMQRNFAEHPELQQSYQNHLEDVERRLANGDYHQSDAGVISIPVVVHVIYRTNLQNISDAQIQSQLDVLTDDFRRTNADANQTPAAFLNAAGDTGIEFCLADTDPNGQTTTGITRTQTTVTNIGSTQQYYVEAPAWDRNKYLNIWVCELQNGLLGFAQFPGTAPANRDGVVISYKYFGTTGTATAPFNKGRTATHEVGHWLGLRHIWGDGGCGVDDNIADTPESDAANYFCATGHVSCGSTDMVQNYMDYSDDACMNLFTNGQGAVMNAVLSGTRGSLVFSNGCSGGGNQGGGDCGVDTLGFPLTGTPALYLSGGTGAWGYVTGHNQYGDDAKANYFANAQGISQLDGLRMQFGAAAAATAQSSVDVKVWSDNAGQPGTVLATETLLIDDIIAAQGEVTVMFTTPVNITGSYFAGIEFAYAPGDTIGLISDTDGDTSPATAWEKWNTGDWYAYDDANSWGLGIQHAIFPIAFINNMTVAVNPASPSIQAGGSVQLTATGADTYTWTPATGLSCTNCDNPMASPTTTTTYTVTGVDVTGQCTTSTDVTVTVTMVNVEDELFGGEISAYPNPNSGEFVLTFDQAEVRDLEIVIFNNLGQKMYAEQLSDFTGSYHKSINLDQVPAGVYHLRITDGVKHYTQKLIIE